MTALVNNYSTSGALVEDASLAKWFASERVLAGTGHRPDKLGREYDLVGPYSNMLRQQLEALLETLKPSKVISGMALGLDQLLAQVAIAANIPVLAAVPCDDQEKVWPKKSQDLYKSIITHKLVTPYVVCPGPYQASAMQTRNKWMCDHSNGLVAAWDGSSGGTANCIKYAREIDMTIWYLKFPEKEIKQAQLFD